MTERRRELGKGKMCLYIFAVYRQNNSGKPHKKPVATLLARGEGEGKLLFAYIFIHLKFQNMQIYYLVTKKVTIP